MAKQDCIPKKDADFLTQLKYLRDKAPTQQAVLNISPADLATLTADAALFEGKFTAFNDADAVYSQTSTDKQTTRAAVEGRERAIIRRFKSATGYTDAIGQLLKIIGPDDTTDLTTAKPDLSAIVKPHGVELSFTKGKSDGVNIYGKRDGDADFVFLAHDTSAPYVDNRPLLVAGKPEVRRYKAIYVVGDDEIGNFSDEVVATVQP
jgi:hypothetical protein